MPFTPQQAIQSLQYEPPVKVAMRFSTRWWTTLQNHRGGVSRTDRPTCIVVDLSYGIDIDTATMLVSYTWTQDAPRNAAFVIRNSNTDPDCGTSLEIPLKAIHALTQNEIVHGALCASFPLFSSYETVKTIY